ncbi:hypothetical protein F5Y07DRAFT_370086 [Xylaria sp. FL0933]|nr:hypothetical protein F5Y07DRAFT_370086 [Xylaria sp. FL0933]
MADESQGTSIEEVTENDTDNTKTQSHKKHKKKKEKKKGKKKTKNKKGKGDKHYAGDLATAKSLKPKHRAWLSALPLILRVGDLGPRYGEVLVVHAGLVPGIPLEDQDPEAVMNMRTLISPSRAHSADNDHDPSLTDPVQRYQSQSQSEHGTNHNAEENRFKPLIPSPAREGTPWAKIWTSYQASTILSRPHTKPTTVVYGHDAKSGLQMRRYTFGLDSGCGSDNVLTGVIFEIPSAAHTNHDSDSDNKYQMDEEGDSDTTSQGQESREQQSRPKIRHRLVSVSCA